ncbi:MAG: hypothetical protein Q7O66_07515 [Dehalococcoidia bacterium]|nr:hypothetical protein [Dehalococcoidia bacterium]
MTKRGTGIDCDVWPCLSDLFCHDVRQTRREAKRQGWHYVKWVRRDNAAGGDVRVSYQDICPKCWPQWKRLEGTP